MEIQALLIAGLSLLFAGNIFFIKRLVDKVDKNNDSNARVENAIISFDSQLKDLKTDIKDLRRIEIEVAVLKSKIRGEE